MGSKSDAEAMQSTLDVLTKLGIDYEVSVISAHRTPEKARQFGQTGSHSTRRKGSGDLLRNRLTKRLTDE